MLALYNEFVFAEVDRILGLKEQEDVWRQEGDIFL